MPACFHQQQNGSWLLEAKTLKALIASLNVDRTDFKHHVLWQQPPEVAPRCMQIVSLVFYLETICSFKSVSGDGIQWLLLQARQKKKMMFGEQHLVRFGSVSRPAGTDPPVILQDSDLDPPQVNIIISVLYSIDESICQSMYCMGRTFATSR